MMRSQVYLFILLFIIKACFSQAQLSTCSVDSSTPNGLCVDDSALCTARSTLALAPGNCPSGSLCCYRTSEIAATTTTTPTTAAPSAPSTSNITALLLQLLAMLGQGGITVPPQITNQQGQCGIKNGLATTPTTSTNPTPTPGRMPILTQRVFNGDRSGNTEFCWNVDIFKSNGGQFVSSGSLISPQWILTSAHRLKNEVSNPNSMVVRLGGTNLMTSTNVQHIPVSKVFLQQNFNPNSPYMENDIALVKLAYPADMSRACLICLPTSTTSISSNTICEVSGRGSNPSPAPANSIPSSYLTVGKLTLLSDEECSPRLKRLLRGYFVFDKSYQCAKSSAGQLACEGDGGSALACPDSSGRYVVYGVSSWGFSCNFVNEPDVYSKVTHNINWVNQIMSQN